jgi:biopolymer transport protein ExbB
MNGGSNKRQHRDGTTTFFAPPLYQEDHTMSFKPQVRTLLTALTLGITLASAGMLPGAAMAQTPAPVAAPAQAAESKPMPPAAAPTIETVDNPYGIDALWKQGDFVAKGTLMILVIMSMGSWYIGIVKLIEQAKMMKQANESDEKFWKTKSIADGLLTLHEDSAFRFVADKGLKASEHHEGNLQQIDLNTWVGMAIQRAIDTVANRLGTGLAFLATVGSTAPFVGLFGTVWGIYHALTAIGIAGQASIDKVAGPVGESLIMTAMGLAVAVPAVLGYNWLVRRNKVVMELLRHFGGGIHMVLVSRHKPGKSS